MKKKIFLLTLEIYKLKIFFLISSFHVVQIKNSFWLTPTSFLHISQILAYKYQFFTYFEIFGAHVSQP